jgi:hypothetical protein
MDRRKLGHRLAFLVHEGHLSLVGLEMMADSFTTIELQEVGRHVHEARVILETATQARKVRENLWKFTGGGGDAS